ncbi:MAG: N-acetylneuraminate synthase [Rhodopseudomonas sp.]|nr:N-acetylneuraminate synthase [Rhodopseudomonas sp.]
MNKLLSSHVTIIAEAGVNHNGQLDLALALVDAAAAAGADVVKFQTFSAERLATGAAGMADYQKRNLGGAEPQIEMLRRLELTPAMHAPVIERCKSRGIEFMSSPFDLESLRFLVEQCDVATIKIPSGEITNGPYLLAIGRSGRKAILSTGMAELAEIAAALDLLAWGYLGKGDPVTIDEVAGTRNLPEARAVLADKIVILQCTTEYPAEFSTINLRAMDTLRETFGLPVGFSDHSEGIAIPIAAVALGAVMVEKHLTLDRTMPGPDHKASIEPQELAAMVAGIRAVGLALGDGGKSVYPVELKNRAIARKSLVAARPIASGAVIAADDIVAKRPGTGLSPMRFWSVIGSTAARAYAPGDLIE